MSPSEDEKTEEQLDAALLDFFRRNDSGESTDREQFLTEHSDIAPQLRELLDAADWIEQMAGPKLSQLGQENELPKPTATRSDQRVIQRETDFSVEGSGNVSDVTVQFFGQHQVVSMSNPGRAVPSEANSDAVTRPPYLNDRLPSDIANVSPDNTQHVLPCRFGDYVLQKILGRGGMGVVYLAEQVQLERRVAIKMIRSGCFAGEEEIQRFYAEARSAARLDHPNIVAVYQCGEIDGHHYFSMDFVPGTDLARRISQGPMEARDAARCVRDVARTIAYAHSQGVLHRDLKPANVLIDEDDHVVITDFGLAKLMGSNDGLTRSGAAIGTPSYMSPEQAEGNTQEHAETTDVYSLGAILFAALTGKPPFQGATAVQTIMDVIHKPAPSAKSLRADTPLDLNTIVSKCLQKQPAQRYQSAQELADELDRYLEGQPILARPLGILQRTARWFVNVPIVAALVGFQAPDPSQAHRWIQRVMLAMIFLFLPILGIAGVRMSRWWNDRSLPMHIGIAAGSPGGMYHTLATQISSKLEAATGHHPTVFATDGSQENMERLLDRRVDLALLQGTAVRSGRVGVVAPMYFEAMHFLARADKPIKTIADLRGLRVAVGTIESGTRQAVAILLEYSSLNFSDFEAMPLDLPDVKSDPSIDAAFAVIKVGHPRVSELLAKGAFHLIPIDNAQSISLEEPTVRPFAIAPTDYQGQISESVQTIATPAFLTARMDTSSRLVEASLQAIYSTDAPIEGLIPAERAAHWQGLPMHPAARRYFESIIEPR
jgi:eukaryotic-like serine/threonine-protein kinase